MQCIGYKEAYYYVKNQKKEHNYKKMVSRTILSTRKLVKKQITWIRKWKNLIELDLEKMKKSDILQIINKYLKN